MKKITIKFTIGILLLLGIIFLIPNTLEAFALIKEKVLGGEYWRLVTYSFVHFNLLHLTENLIGLLLVGIIAYELKVNSSEYLGTFFSSAVLAVLPLWAIVTFIAAGSSSVMYALFGLVSFDMKKFGLKVKYVLPILVLIIFSKSLYYFFTNTINKLNTTLIQDLAHFSGLAFGVVLYIGIWTFKHYKEKRASFLLRAI